MLSNAALSEPSPVVTPLATTDVTLGATVLVRSTSSTLSVPLVVRTPFVSLPLHNALLPPDTVMSGLSFPPVSVTTTSCVRLALAAPLSSVTVIRYIAVTVSPAVRY